MTVVSVAVVTASAISPTPRIQASLRDRPDWQCR